MKRPGKVWLSMLLALMLTFSATAALSDSDYDGTAPVSAEPAKISVLSTNGASLINDFDSMTWWQEVLKKANVTIDFELIDTSSYADVVKPRLAAGVDLPDLVQLSGGDADMSYINSGLFIDLTEMHDK